MSWWPNERWRETYDAWKLATPPEYDEQEPEIDEQELEFIDWLESEIDWQTQRMGAVCRLQDGPLVLNLVEKPHDN